MKNLYLACTPLQILNATEARDRFHSGEQNYLVFVQSPRKSAALNHELRRLTDSLIDDCWEKVWNLHATKLDQILFPWLSKKINKEVSPCSLLYAGGFQTQLRHLINVVNHEELIITDGGAGCSESALQQKTHSKKLIYRFLPGMRAEFPCLRNARFFTSYNLQLEANRRIQNDYRMLRQRIKKQYPIRNELVFISQPLEKDLGIRVETERLIEHAKRLHGVERCRHILHPRENQGTANSERLRCLVELFALHEGYLPKAFATYMSSAARSLQLIYGVPITCFDVVPLLPSGTPKNLVREITQVYDDLHDSGLNVLPIPADCYYQAILDAAPRRAA
ncbi:hypothetical protein SH139x_001294 [Planctomycetaceae bacterium SH139]